MLKIDYILLVKHFREETLEEENLTILAWQNESITNKLTYKRLRKIYQKDCVPSDNQKIGKEETKEWKNIITKILEEKVEE
jgi:hypothetical protein